MQKVQPVRPLVESRWRFSFSSAGSFPFDPAKAGQARLRVN